MKCVNPMKDVDTSVPKRLSYSYTICLSAFCSFALLRSGITVTRILIFDFTNLCPYRDQHLYSTYGNTPPLASRALSCYAPLGCSRSSISASSRLSSLSAKRGWLSVELTDGGTSSASLAHNMSIASVTNLIGRLPVNPRFWRRHHSVIYHPPLTLH